jgi:hypothetical protein
MTVCLHFTLHNNLVEILATGPMEDLESFTKRRALSGFTDGKITKGHKDFFTKYKDIPLTTFYLDNLLDFSKAIYHDGCYHLSREECLASINIIHDVQVAEVDTSGG